MTNRARTALAKPLPANYRNASYFTNRALAGTAVRRNLPRRYDRYFNTSWWNARRHLWYHHRWHWCHKRPVVWWRWCNWAAVSSWVVWTWPQPYYYEYNVNVLYEDDTVYMNEEPVSSAEDYLAAGDTLADVDPFADDAEVSWMPLGVFALATTAADLEPKMLVQLVLSRDGRIGGMYYHTTTDNAQAIQGSVDESLQRAVFTIGDRGDPLLELGLANLGEDETPLWVHFQATNETQTWTLYRLDAPAEAGQPGEPVE